MDPRRLRELRNEYKRQDVFRCVHDAHAHFSNRVSVHHVLTEKKCFPGGCIYFLWRCKLLNKGTTCPRGFRHVGRKCFGCREFYDEKVINRPEILLDETGFRTFRADFEKFKDWVEEVRGREVCFTGTVSAVKPMLTRVPSGKKETLRFGDFLVCFDGGFFDMTRLDDLCYLVVGRPAYGRHRFRRGDRVELWAKVGFDRGRVVMVRPRRIDFEDRGDGNVWREGDAIVAARIGTVVSGQPEPCVACEKGCLVDVAGGVPDRGGRRRELVCLEGNDGPEGCAFRIERILTEHRCVHDKVDGRGRKA